jgi:hypothetical protein
VTLGRWSRCVLFLLLGFAPPLSSSSTLADFAGLGHLHILSILTVDLGENLLDVRVWVRVDEMAEQICEAEEVSEAANGIIFLQRSPMSVMRFCM